MASAKKRRGRDRKAARKNNINNDNGRTIRPTSWERGIELVRRGHFVTTSSAIARFRDNEGERPLFVRAGLLDVVFDHLGRCNEDFGSVMSDIGGDLQTPVIWVELLLSVTVSDECHSQIIDNIDPLFRCMCDDVERKLFGSKKYWHQAIFQFAGIIYRMLSVESNFTKLSQYEGLIEKIVQWWFWESHRLDFILEFEEFLHP